MTPVSNPQGAGGAHQSERCAKGRGSSGPEAVGKGGVAAGADGADGGGEGAAGADEHYELLARVMAV